jgi:polysaccharide deacetylase family protein (PEP-CTERM system associated)
MTVKNSGTRHAMSVDVEDWLNATILQETGKIYPPGDAVMRNSLDLLEIFSRHNMLATWFFLGEVAEAFPDLVRRVADAGHELGVHGFHHHQIRKLSPENFRDSILRAKHAVEQAGGSPALGYRAVDFSINTTTWWALDILLDAGFTYDASIFPMRMPRYGISGAQTGPHWIKTLQGRWIYEIPITVCEVPGARFPFAGGGYFRLLPYRLLSLMMQWSARRRQVVFYIHPCEIEASSALPKVPEDITTSELQRINSLFITEKRGRKNGRKKLDCLFKEYRFCSIADAFCVKSLVRPN